MAKLMLTEYISSFQRKKWTLLLLISGQEPSKINKGNSFLHGFHCLESLHEFNTAVPCLAQDEAGIFLLLNEHTAPWSGVRIGSCMDLLHFKS